MCVKVESKPLGRSKRIFEICLGFSYDEKRDESAKKGGVCLVAFLVVKNLPIIKAARPETPRLLSTRR